ncbi:MAG: putative metal-binding motif-containing protein [Myxococcales bacterium]|nr:putative metal-binding motif-containing protein [Myxococcales bacterium]
MRAVALSAFLLAGCLGASGTATVSGSATARASVRAELRPLAPPTASPGLAPGVEALEVPCDAAVAETCNGVDDDCDGRVDEGAGCPYEGGPMHVVVAWNSDADLDLYVTEPSGEIVSFQSPTSESGAELQHAGRGRCGEPSDPAARVESLRFTTRPPPGQYVVALHYLMECSPQAGATTAVLSVTIGGRRYGTWTYTLTPNERVEVLRFTLDE